MLPISKNVMKVSRCGARVEPIAHLRDDPRSYEAGRTGSRGGQYRRTALALSLFYQKPRRM